MACPDTLIGMLFGYFALAFVITLVFLIFEIPGFRHMLEVWIPNYWIRIVSVGALFFAVVYIIDRVFIKYRVLTECIDNE